MKIYTIAMLAVAAFSLIPAGLFLIGEPDWLYSFNRAAYKDKKEYSRFLGKIVLLFTADCVLSALLSLLLPSGIAGILAAAGLVAILIYASKKAPDYYYR